jgi:hypothetical protein
LLLYKLVKDITAFSLLGMDPVLGCFQHSKEPPRSKKGGEVLAARLISQGRVSAMELVMS